MWALQNKTPFEAEQAFDRDEAGREVLCIALRGTFQARPDGLCETVADPHPVLLAPVYHGQALAFDADILPFLPGAELTVHGTADPVLDVPRIASVSLGTMTKSVALHPRLRRRAHQVELDPDPEALPLDWTVCLGGMAADGDLHPENPLGLGMLGQTHPTDGPLPRITATTERPETARTVTGLTPLQRHWQPRLSAAGTYDAQWSDTRAPLLPADFERRFYHAAPADQCFPAALSGGERLTVSGFAATGEMDIRLPQAVIDLRAEFESGQDTASAKIYRIRVFPALGRFDVLWLASVSCNGRDHLLRRTTVNLRQIAGIVR